MDMREEGGDEFGNVGLDQDQESDDDFVVVKKKGRPRKNDIKPKKVKNCSKLKKSSTSKRSLNSASKAILCEKSPHASLTTSASITSSAPIVVLKSGVVDDLKALNFAKEENVTDSNETDHNSNLNDEKPVTIATPEQINRRSFDQEEFLTPSSTPMEERPRQEEDSCDKIVQRMAGAVARSLQFLPPASSSSSPLQPCESQVTTPVPFHPPPSQQVLPEVTTSQLDQTEDTNAPLQSQTPISQVPAAGRGRRPTHPHRPGLVRQPVPSTRPNLRPAAPRMQRPPRPRLPRNPVAGGPYRPGRFGPRAPLSSAGLRLSNIRSITPVKHQSLSSYHTSQHPVVEIDDSPPRSYQASQ